MHKLTFFLGVLVAVLHGSAFIIYNIQTKQGKSDPNPVSWSIWAFLATMNALTYREMSGDVVATFQFYTGSVACTLTFLYVLAIGEFAWLEPEEWLLFLLGLAASLVYWKFRNATGGNLIILVAFLISFYPTFKAVLENPFKETPTAWNIWTLALFLNVVNIALRGGEPIAFLMPGVLLICHWSIAWLSRPKRKEQFRFARA